MTAFRDADFFVSQCGAASAVSGDGGEIPSVKTEGICKNKC